MQVIIQLLFWSGQLSQYTVQIIRSLVYGSQECLQAGGDLISPLSTLCFITKVTIPLFFPTHTVKLNFANILL